MHRKGGYTGRAGAREGREGLVQSREELFAADLKAFGKPVWGLSGTSRSLCLHMC